MPRVGRAWRPRSRSRDSLARSSTIENLAGRWTGGSQGGPGSCLAPLDSNSRWSGQNVELLLAEQRIGLDTERF